VGIIAAPRRSLCYLYTYSAPGLVSGLGYRPCVTSVVGLGASCVWLSVGCSHFVVVYGYEVMMCGDAASARVRGGRQHPLHPRGLSTTQSRYLASPDIVYMLAFVLSGRLLQARCAVTEGLGLRILWMCIELAAIHV
jgi:hypothetical protein